MATATQITSTVITVAATQYLARRDRTQHPDGRFDRKGRWYAADAERRACCNGIRTPSAAYPYNQMLHCRTAEHVASLHGVSASDVRRAARQLDRNSN